MQPFGLCYRRAKLLKHGCNFYNGSGQKMFQPHFSVRVHQNDLNQCFCLHRLLAQSNPGDLHVFMRRLCQASRALFFHGGFMAASATIKPRPLRTKVSPDEAVPRGPGKDKLFRRIHAQVLCKVFARVLALLPSRWVKVNVNQQIMTHRSVARTLSRMDS